MATALPSPQPSTGVSGSSTRYISGYQMLPNGYSFRQKMNPDGTVGIDYYDDLRNPIWNWQFQQATGLDTNQIERGSVDLDQVWSDYESQQKQTALANMSNLGIETGTPEESGGGSGGSSGYPRAFEGKLYNTPEELASAVHASALVKYNENNKVIEDSYKKGLLTYDEYLKMARDNADSVKKTRDQNLSNIQGYFNKVAPDAVQSQQAVMQDSANADYNKVVANTGNLFDGKSATDIANMDLSPYANDITTTGKIARGIQGVNDAKTKSVQNNNDYMNSVNWDNFAMLNPTPTSANTGLTDFLQNLATQVYAGQGSGGGITGQTSSSTVDAYGNPIKKTDEFGNPIK